MSQILDLNSYEMLQDEPILYLEETSYSFYLLKIKDFSNSIIDIYAQPIKHRFYLSDISPLNKTLFTKHVIYLPKDQRDSLPETYKLWRQFLEAQELLMSTQNYPDEIPQEQRSQIKADPTEAIKVFHDLADAEDNFAPANYFLALAYENGWNERDDDKVLLYYKKSAKQEIAEANYELGLKYKYSNSSPQNKEKEKRYLKRASKQGHIEAKYALGQTYQMAGKDQKAFSLFLEAADLGDAKSCHEVGNYYANGRGGEFDQNKAISYYNKAIKAGHKPAEESLARVIRDLDSYVVRKSSIRSLSPIPAYESSESSSLEKCSPKRDTGDEIEELRRIILSMQADMLDMKKRLAALENPKASRKHGGKESPSKRQKFID